MLAAIVALLSCILLMQFFIIGAIGQVRDAVKSAVASKVFPGGRN